MPLPSSGLISLDMVASELSIPNTNLELGDIRIRTLANKLTGDISLSDLYGKSVVKSIVGEYQIKNAVFGRDPNYKRCNIIKDTPTSGWASGCSASVYKNGVLQPLNAEISGKSLLTFGMVGVFNGSYYVPYIRIEVEGEHSQQCQFLIDGFSSGFFSRYTYNDWSGYPKTIWQTTNRAWDIPDNASITLIFK